MLFEANIKLHMTKLYLKNFFFGSKNGGMGPKIFFFEVIKNTDHYFFCVSSVIKVCIFCCIPVPIPCLREIYFLKYRSIALRQSNCRTFKVSLDCQSRFYLLQWKPFENDEICFLFFLKFDFVLKIFKFLSRFFWPFRKMA